jgi:hypothetical protein
VSGSFNDQPISCARAQVITLLGWSAYSDQTLEIRSPRIILQSLCWQAVMACFCQRAWWAKLCVGSRPAALAFVRHRLRCRDMIRFDGVGANLVSERWSKPPFSLQRSAS